MEVTAVKNPNACTILLEEGFSKEKVETIERGLVLAYEFLIDYLLDGNSDALSSLSRDLNAVYFPYRFYANEPANVKASYLGQVRSLINLSDYVSNRLVPDRLWQVVSQTKYGRTILQVLSKEGAVQAKELCSAVGIPHNSQLSRTASNLVDQAIIRRQQVGKNVWYSLSAIGKLMAARYCSMKETSAIESFIPTILTRLQRGRQDFYNLVECVDETIPLPSRQIILRQVLSALSAAGIVEEQDGSWGITSQIRGKSAGDIHLLDIKHPLLDSAAGIIKLEYEQYSMFGIVSSAKLMEAKELLAKVEAEVSNGEDKQAGLIIRNMIETAKLYALNRNWREAINMMKQLMLVTRNQGVEMEVIQRELDIVWSYVETFSIRPLVWKAKQMVRRADFGGVASSLMLVNEICKEVSRPLTMVNAVSELLDTVAKGSLAADDIKEIFALGLKSEAESRIKTEEYDLIDKSTTRPTVEPLRDYLVSV